MGFGLLFIGYIFFLYVFPVGPEFLSVAAAILLMALYKLAPYHAGFRRAAYLSVALLVLGLPALASILLEGYGVTLPLSPTVSACFTAAAWATLIVFHWLLFGAIADLAKATSLFRLQVAATQNRIFTAVFCALLLINQVLTPYVVSQLSETDGKRVLLYILIGKALFGLIICALNLVMLYSAYMRICRPGEERRGIAEYEQFIDTKNAAKGPSKEDPDK